MIKNFLNNKKRLEQANVRIEDHDACGVGFVASMTGKHHDLLF
jgi:glutamate synthase domain-containing protein 1